MEAILENVMRKHNLLFIILVLLASMAVSTTSQADTIILPGCMQLGMTEEEIADCKRSKLVRNSAALKTPGNLGTVCAVKNQGFNFLATYDVGIEVDVKISGHDAQRLRHLHPSKRRKFWNEVSFKNLHTLPSGRFSTPLPLDSYYPNAVMLLGTEHCYDIFATQGSKRVPVRQAKRKKGRILIEVGGDEDFDDAIIHIEKYSLNEKDVLLRWNGYEIEVCHDVGDVFYFMTLTAIDLSINQSPREYGLEQPPLSKLYEIDSKSTGFDRAFWYSPEHAPKGQYLGGTFSHVTTESKCSSITLFDRIFGVGCEITSSTEFRCKYGGGRDTPYFLTKVLRFKYSAEPFDFRPPCRGPFHVMGDHSNCLQPQ